MSLFDSKELFNDEEDNFLAMVVFFFELMLSFLITFNPFIQC